MYDTLWFASRSTETKRHKQNIQIVPHNPKKEVIATGNSDKFEALKGL